MQQQAGRRGGGGDVPPLQAVFQQAAQHVDDDASQQQATNGNHGETIMEGQAEQDVGTAVTTPLKEVFAAGAAAASSSPAQATGGVMAPSPQKSPDSTERVSNPARLQELFEEAERRKAKLKELENTLPAECTFSPAINRYRTKDERELVSPEKRIEKLYEDAKLKEERRKQAIEEATKKVDPEARFTPEISTRAAKFAMPGGAVARTEKLYQDALAKKEKQEALRLEAEKRAAAELTFRPTIQPLKIRLNEPRPLPQRRAPSPTQASTGPVPDVVSRLLSAEQKRAEHLARLEKEKLERERSEYTFAPQIHTRPSSPKPQTPTPVSRSQQQDMGGDDRWSRLSKAGARNYAALEEAKEKLEVKDCTFKPVVHATPPTSALVITAEKVDVHSRLYDDARTRLRDDVNPVIQTAGPIVIKRGNSPVTIRRAPSPQSTSTIGRPRGAASPTTVVRAPSPSAPTPLRSPAARGGSPLPTNPLKASPLVVPTSGGARPVTPTKADTTPAVKAQRQSAPAFGSSSASRIPDPKNSDKVAPILPKDSAVVVPSSDPVTPAPATVKPKVTPLSATGRGTVRQPSPVPVTSSAVRRQSPTPMAGSTRSAPGSQPPVRRAQSPSNASTGSAGLVSPPSPRLGGRIVSKPIPSSNARSVVAVPAKPAVTTNNVSPTVAVATGTAKDPFSSVSAFSPLKAGSAPKPAFSPSARPPPPRLQQRAPSPTPRRSNSPVNSPPISSPRSNQPQVSTPPRAPSPKIEAQVSMTFKEESPKLDMQSSMMFASESTMLDVQPSMQFEELEPQISLKNLVEAPRTDPIALEPVRVEEEAPSDAVVVPVSTDPVEEDKFADGGISAPTTSNIEAATVAPSSPARIHASQAAFPSTPTTPVTEALRWNAEVKDEDL